MEDYRQRPHDSLVEPLFGGLRSEPRRDPYLSAARSPALWAFIAVCAALVALRVLTL